MRRIAVEKWAMDTSSDAVRDPETATERLQLQLERLRSELDQYTTRLHMTKELRTRERHDDNRDIAAGRLR
jgi:hypothetical protein